MYVWYKQPQALPRFNISATASRGCLRHSFNLDPARGAVPEWVLLPKVVAP